MKPIWGDIAWAFASNCFLFAASLVYLHFCDITFPTDITLERCTMVCGGYCIGSISLVVWKADEEEFQGLYVNHVGKWMGKVIACLGGMVIDSSFPDQSVPAIVVSFLLWLAVLCGKQVMQPTQDLGFLDMTVTMVVAKGYETLSGSPAVIAVPLLCFSMVGVEVILQRKYWAINQNQN